MEAAAAMQKKHREWGAVHAEIRRIGDMRFAMLPWCRTQRPLALPPLPPVLGETASGHGAAAAEAAEAAAEDEAAVIVLNALGTIRYRSKEDKESDERMLKRVAEERAAEERAASGPVTMAAMAVMTCKQGQSRSGLAIMAAMPYLDDADEVIPPTMYNWHGMPLRCETRLQLGLEQDEQPQPGTQTHRLSQANNARAARAARYKACEKAVAEVWSAAADDLELTTNSEGEHVPRLDRDRRDQRTRMLEATLRLHRRIERAIERSESSSHDAN